MVSCPCCWSKSHGTKNKLIQNDETGTTVYWAMDDSDRSLNKAAEQGSKTVKGGWWRRNKSVKKLDEGKTVHSPIQVFIKDGEIPEGFFDKALLNSALPSGYSGKEVVGTEPIPTQAPIIQPNVSIVTRSLPKSRTSTPIHRRPKTFISDWGDAYEGSNSLCFSSVGSLMYQTGLSTSFTENESVGTIRSETNFEPKKIAVPDGKVMGMLLGKEDYRFQILDLNSSLDEVVNLFLFIECGVRLSLSFAENDFIQPKIMSKRRMAMTIKENLGPQFDVKTQGLTFSTGFVNSDLCYKMTVCQLTTMENIFCFTNSNNNMAEE